MCHPDKTWEAWRLSTGHRSFPPSFNPCLFHFPGFFFLTKLLYLPLLVI